MKRLLALMIVAVVWTGCTKVVMVNKPKSPPSGQVQSLPPGQAKKMTGSQSAREYAPGQNKTNSSATGQSKSNAGAPGQSKKKN